MTMQPALETLVDNAIAGDKNALEQIVEAINDRVYNLSLRMLWHPQDAEDATQEILVRIVTNLSSFRGESAFTTWVYRVASNYLLTTRKRRAERNEVTFDDFGAQLDIGLSDNVPEVASEVEHKLLIDEVRIGCTHGMLLCLDRDHRIAYILGEILELNSTEGAYVIGIGPAAFRKRLSRARKRILEFMQKKCGIFNQQNPCRCSKRIEPAIASEHVNPAELLFAGDASDPDKALLLYSIGQIERFRRAAAIYRASPDYKAPEDFAEHMKKLIESASMPYDA